MNIALIDAIRSANVEQVNRLRLNPDNNDKDNDVFEDSPMGFAITTFLGTTDKETEKRAHLLEIIGLFLQQNSLHPDLLQHVVYSVSGNAPACELIDFFKQKNALTAPTDATDTRLTRHAIQLAIPNLLEKLIALQCPLSNTSFDTATTRYSFMSDREKERCLNVLEILKKNNIPIDATPDFLGRKTALLNTMILNNTDFTTWLLNNGANPNHVDLEGKTALMHLAQSTFEKTAAALAQLLVDKGADIHRTDSKGLSALDYANLQRKTELAQMLISLGASTCTQKPCLTQPAPTCPTSNITHNKPNKQ